MQYDFLKTYLTLQPPLDDIVFCLTDVEICFLFSAKLLSSRQECYKLPRNALHDIYIVTVT